MEVLLDTSFLISFADDRRSNHAVAVDYFRYCLAQSIPMWISVISAGEFEVRQPIADLPLQNFRILPYNLLHAIKAAELYRALEKSPSKEQENRRIVINDLKLIAQAEEESIPVILTEDMNTLAKIVGRLKAKNAASTDILLLSEGFTPNRVNGPDQTELSL